MAQNAAQILVPAGASLNVAAYGAALPTAENSALSSAYNELGYIGPEGVSAQPSIEKLTVEADQSMFPVLERIVTSGLGIGFTLLQWNEDTVKLAFGGGTVSEVTTGHYKYEPPSAGSPYEFTLVYDFTHGVYLYRLVLKRATVDNPAPVGLSSRAHSPLAVGAMVLDVPGNDAAWAMLTDDPAWAPGSQS